MKKDCIMYYLNVFFYDFNLGKFIIEFEDFWTLPYSYSEMVTHDSELYTKLASSQMLIFKGINLNTIEHRLSAL